MKRTIYRRKNWRTGKREKRYTIGFEMPNGSIAYERAYSDKQASEQLLAQREKEVAREAVGLTDPYDKHRRRPVAEHVKDYLASMRGKGRTSEHVARVESRLRRSFSAMLVRTLADLTVDSAERFLDEMVNARRSSLTNRNHYASTLRAFGAWLEKLDRLPKHPLRKLAVVNVTDGDRSRTSRVPTTDELRRIVEVAPPHRRRLYLFTAYTGFRRGEDKATTWADLQLDGDAPTVRLWDTKNGDHVHVGIPVWLASELRQHAAELTLQKGSAPKPTDKVFHITNDVVEQLREDAAKAGLGTITKHYHTTESGNVWRTVEWHDPAGPRMQLILHSLRAYFATMLFEQGVPVHEVQRLCRHRSIQTTIKHYTVWREVRLRAAVDSLPNPMQPVAVPVSVVSIPTVTASVLPRPEATPARGGQAVAR